MAAPPQLEREYEGEPWTRQKWETAKAFKAFTVYLDMQEHRSLAKLAEHFGYRSDRYPKTWSSKYEWQARVDAYDARLMEIHRQKRESEHSAQLDRFIQRQSEVYEVLNATAVHCLRISRERLASMTKDEIAEMKPSELATFLRTAAYVAEVAGNAQAQALGVEELLFVLTNE